MTFRLLIVEDDETLRVGLRDYFVSQGFTVTEASDGYAGQMRLREGEFDLAILDVMMPGPDGFALLREFRERDTKTPVLILTARGEENEKVLGFEIGADDYVTKPFGLREVAARVRAHLRKAGVTAAAVPKRFAIGAAQVDLAAYQLTCGDATHSLSPKEVGILELLYRDSGEVVSRARILDEVWGTGQFVSDRTIDTHILHLRKKLEVDPKRPAHLLTVHGAGYRLQL